MKLSDFEKDTEQFTTETLKVYNEIIYDNKEKN